MNFVNDNMQVHIAKGLKVSIIQNILTLNFEIEKKMIEWIPLINISYAIKSFMEMLQVVKYFTHKFTPEK